MLSDIEIAQKAEMKPITEIGESIGIPAKAVWIWLKKSSPPLIRAPTITHSMIWKAA